METRVVLLWLGYPRDNVFDGEDRARMKRPLKKLRLALVTLFFLPTLVVTASETPKLPDTIEKIKPSIVGIGTFQRTRRPPSIFRGTGFVIADGLHVATNAHVLPPQSRWR